MPLTLALLVVLAQRGLGSVTMSLYLNVILSLYPVTEPLTIAVLVAVAEGGFGNALQAVAALPASLGARVVLAEGGVLIDRASVLVRRALAVTVAEGPVGTREVFVIRALDGPSRAGVIFAKLNAFISAPQAVGPPVAQGVVPNALARLVRPRPRRARHLHSGGKEKKG